MWSEASIRNPTTCHHQATAHGRRAHSNPSQLQAHQKSDGCLLHAIVGAVQRLPDGRFSTEPTWICACPPMSRLQHWLLLPGSTGRWSPFPLPGAGTMALQLASLRPLRLLCPSSQPQALIWGVLCFLYCQVLRVQVQAQPLRILLLDLLGHAPAACSCMK